MASTAGIKAGKAFVLIEAADKTSLVLRRISTKFNNWGKKMGETGKRMMLGAVAGLTPAAFSTKTFASFDDAMKKVEARSSGTAEELANLRKQAKFLGRTTSFTAVEIASLQAVLSQRGFSRPEIAAQTPHVLDLARSIGDLDDSMGSITGSTRLMSGIIQAWQMEVGGAVDIADLLTAAVNNSALTLESMGDSLGYVAPLAAQSGLGLKDTLKILGQLANVWIEGSRAGTSFRRMMIKLAENLEDLTGQRIEVQTAGGGFNDLADIMKQIDKATKGLTKVERLGIFEEIFGARAMGASAALTIQTEQTQRLTDALDNAGQSANHTAAMMDSGLGGSLRLTTSALEGVKLALGDAISEGLGKFLEVSREVMGSLVEWIDNNQELVTAVTVTIAAIGAAGLALVGLGLSFKLVGVGLGVLTTGLGLVQTALLLITTPFGAAIAISGLMLTALYKLSDAFQGLADRVGGIVSSRFEGIADVAKTTVKGISLAIAQGNIGAAWDILLAGLKLGWSHFGDFILDIWDTVTNAIVIGMKTAVTGLESGFTMAKSKIRSGFASVMSPLMSIRDTVTGNTAGADAIAYQKSLARQEYKAAGEMWVEHDDFLIAQSQMMAAKDKVRTAELAALNEKLGALVTELENPVEPLPEEAEQIRAIEKNAKEEDTFTRKAITPTELLQGLEKGSIEAAKKSYENRNRSRTLTVQQDQLAVLERIHTTIEDQNTIQEA